MVRRSLVKEATKGDLGAERQDNPAFDPEQSRFLRTFLSGVASEVRVKREADQCS